MTPAPALADYPLPSLPALLDRIDASVAAILSSEDLVRYRASINALLPVPNRSTLGQAKTSFLVRLENVIASLAGKPNWAEESFLKLLLSNRTPMALTLRLCLRIQLPQQPPCLSHVTRTYSPRVRAAASILYATAIFAVEGYANPTTTQSLFMPQISGLLSTARMPSEEMDSLHTTPIKEARHATVWAASRPWTVTLIGEDGTPLGPGAIIAQLDEIEGAKAGHGDLVPLAHLSTVSTRDVWTSILASLSENAHNASVLQTLRSALVTLALEAYPGPADPAAFLEELRTGSSCNIRDTETAHAHSGDPIGPINRWADQTCGAVVYLDGTAGLTYDHIPADCGAAAELSRELMRIIYTRQPSPHTSDQVYHATPLEFHWPATPLPVPTLTIPSDFQRLVDVCTLPYPTTGTTILARETVRLQLTDAIVCLAFQCSLLRAFNDVPKVVFQPVWQRSFVNGRCDPMWPVTSESLALSRAILQSKEAIGEEVDKSGLVEKFMAYLARRKSLIALSLTGVAPGNFMELFVTPLLFDDEQETDSAETERLREHLEVVKRSWETQGSGTIYFTGLVSKNRTNGKTDGVVAGLSNAYSPNQLDVFYLSQPCGEITVTSLGTGSFIPTAKAVGEGMHEVWAKIIDIAELWAGQQATTS